MKCTSCGAEIGLTDKVCPHCGRVLTETTGYRRDKKKYRSDSEKTKKTIKGIIGENIPIVVSAIVMLLLFIAIGIASYVKENAYHFKEDALRKESAKNYEEYSALIRDYLDAGDYTGFVAFKEYHNIAEWEEPYDKLELLWDIAKEYSDLVYTVESSVMYGAEARIYLPESDINDCHSAIWQFYNEYENSLSNIDSDPYKDYMHDMKKKADIILETYLGMDEKEREAYFAGSEFEQKAYLEEVLGNE